jgi:hypothetical protein
MMVGFVNTGAFIPRREEDCIPSVDLEEEEDADAGSLQVEQGDGDDGGPIFRTTGLGISFCGRG